MSLYLGDNVELCVYYNGELHNLILWTKELITDGIVLNSSDGYRLTTLEGFVLTAKEDE